MTVRRALLLWMAMLVGCGVETPEPARADVRASSPKEVRVEPPPTHVARVEVDLADAFVGRGPADAAEADARVEAAYALLTDGRAAQLPVRASEATKPFDPGLVEALDRANAVGLGGL